MEKRVRNIAIVSAIAAILLLVLLVWQTNQPAAAPGGKEGGAQTAQEEEDPFRAFLKDDTFFDSDSYVSSVQVSESADNSKRLYLQASSVLKDIRITITDAEGVPVTGQSFFVNVDPLHFSLLSFRNLPQP